MTINKKKLLILGANTETIPLVEVAKGLGVNTYVTDFNPDAPAKKVADVPCNIDCMDLEALEKLCVEEKIDGVMVGVADSLVKVYAKLCHKLSLPCYATIEQAEILSNKKRFDEYCKQFDIPTIPNYEVSLENFEETSKNINYPVFVKPVDGNSGLGMSICYNKKELYSGIEKAVNASRSKKYMVEKYMECDDMFLNFTFVDGKYSLTAMANRYTIKQGNNASRVCVGAVYSDKYFELYKKTLEQKLFELFSYLDLENGVLMLSAFVEGGKIHLYDPGFRLQGEAPDIHIEKATGFDQKKFLINFALGISHTQFSMDLDWLKKRDQKFLTIWILLKDGIIRSIDGLESLTTNPAVYKLSQRLFIGDSIQQSMLGTERQVFARAYLKLQKNEQEYFSIVKILNTIKISNDKSSLIINPLKEEFYK